MTYQPKADGGAIALEMYGLMRCYYDKDAARLTYDTPFPASLWNGLNADDSNPYEVLNKLRADLDALERNWDNWHATHHVIPDKGDING